MILSGVVYTVPQYIQNKQNLFLVCYVDFPFIYLEDAAIKRLKNCLEKSFFVANLHIVFSPVLALVSFT